MNKNGRLFKEAVDAIEVLFSDMSVSKSVCRENMESLIDDIKNKIDSLGM